MTTQIKDVESYNELVTELDMKRLMLTALYYEVKLLEYYLDDFEAGKTKEEIKKERGRDPLSDIDPFSYRWNNTQCHK